MYEEKDEKQQLPHLRGNHENQGLLWQVPGGSCWGGEGVYRVCCGHPEACQCGTSQGIQECRGPTRCPCGVTAHGGSGYLQWGYTDTC